ncbi:MAG: Fe-S cluster assembly protein SufB [Candidatus Nomurabacteria bacterium]|nr:MAG: Fe-S cluster assembly protein SufB [Candidatus Nomurabacteria bacterium]
MSQASQVKKTNEYQYGFHDPDSSVYRSQHKLSDELIRDISAQKHEPEWMRDFRLHALKQFMKKSMPKWGADLSRLDFDAITYYVRPSEASADKWDEVPDDIKRTFDRLGIPEAERKYLAGVGAQYDSEVIYHNVRETLDKLGVVFLSMDEGLRRYPDLVREHFGTVVPPGDNKFAALNSAVWSGGSFVYVPKGVKVDLPLQAYFRINTEAMGQFERTLIIADEGSEVHYVEGCTAPIYSKASLHSAVVEIIAKPGARVRYTTIQNWSQNVYNLVTKRAIAFANATVEWIDGNIGSCVTMKYPSVYLMGEGARAEILSLAYANSNQHQDAGGKAIHVAPNTSSLITSKSVSQGNGRTSYRGVLQVQPGAKNVQSKVKCDALLLDLESRTDTYPRMDVHESATIEHEATVSRIGQDQLFYLMSRGLSEDEAAAMVVNGFLEPIVKELPMEYAMELNRLIGLEMEGSVG